MKRLLCLLALASCHDQRQPSPLPQRAYVWQREWTPAVSSAVKLASPKLSGLVIFGAEITWQGGKPKAVRGSVDWAALRALHQPLGIAMRIAPWPGPFDDAVVTQSLVSAAQSLLERARQEQVDCTEFQIDFDSAQKKLDGYSRWLVALRQAVKPTRFVITALPTWLDEPALPRLLDQVDAYVLQVHSVAPPKASEHVAVCDPARARRWMAKAAELKRPFEVALSTYSALAGYDETGRLLGLALDGVQPAWPGGTRIMQFDSDADALARLVCEWQGQRPARMQGVLWYRLPVTTDTRNWRWPTFAAVIEGRAPIHQMTVKMQGENPIDLSLINDGEADEPLDHLQVIATWEGPPPAASEALPGWTVTVETNRARFLFSAAQTQRLSPGAQRGMGWLRFDQRASLHVEIIR